MNSINAQIIPWRNAYEKTQNGCTKNMTEKAMVVDVEIPFQREILFSYSTILMITLLFLLFVQAKQ